MASMHRHHEAPRPTDVLREEHVFILRALGVGEALARQYDATRTIDRPVLTSLVTFLKAFADRCHHGKEETHLFPAMARHGVPEDGGPIGVMLGEHEEGRRLLAATTAPDDAKAAAALTHYVRLLRAHIDKENDVLFSIAESVLPDDEKRGLLRAFDAVAQEIGSAEHDRLLRELERLEAATQTTS